MAGDRDREWGTGGSGGGTGLQRQKRQRGLEVLLTRGRKVEITESS